MSYMRYMTLYSFCKFNPDWTVYLIENNLPQDRPMTGTVEKQDKAEYNGPDYTAQLDTLPLTRIDFDVSMLDLLPEVVYSMSDVHIKDILNWKLLSEGCGVVADMDILFTAPLTSSIQEDADIGLICFNGFPQKDYIPVSFMYASKETSFFKYTYKRALLNYNPLIYESCGTLCIEESNIQEIISKYPDINIQKLEDAIVFPLVDYPWGTGIDMLYKGKFVDKLHPASVGIHWYGGAPQSQQFNNTINHTMFEGSLTTTNTITLKIKEILSL